MSVLHTVSSGLRRDCVKCAHRVIRFAARLHQFCTACHRVPVMIRNLMVLRQGSRGHVVPLFRTRREPILGGSVATSMSLTVLKRGTTHPLLRA